MKLKKFRCCYIYNSILVSFFFLVSLDCDEGRGLMDVDEILQIEVGLCVCGHEFGS